MKVLNFAFLDFKAKLLQYFKIGLFSLDKDTTLLTGVG
jgi:hypothetical protein